MRIPIFNIVAFRMIFFGMLQAGSGAHNLYIILPNDCFGSCSVFVLQGFF